MARPYEHIPRTAKSHLMAMAENGCLTESAAANSIGMPLEHFRKLIQSDEQSKSIWETCLAIERDNLLSALYSKAESGDVKAAQILLAARHGVSDKTPQQTTGGVQVVFQLPDAMDAKSYVDAVTKPLQALEGKSDA